MSERIEVREGVFIPMRDATNRELMDAWSLAKDKRDDHEEEARIILAEMFRRVEEEAG